MSGVEVAVRDRAAVGEGPVWTSEGVLLWVDIPRALVHRFDPSAGTDETVGFDEAVTAIAPRASGGFVAACANGFASLDVGSGRLARIAPVEADDDGTRMNDGKCGPGGHFFAGTMPYDVVGRREAGSLYRLDADGSVTTVFTGVGLSNGLAWSADGTVMYYIDTLAGSVDVCDHDPATGAVSNRRVLVRPDRGLPDGMCTDAEGCLWVALFGGWGVQRYAPDGEPLERIELPVAQVTCCAFGGPDLDRLFITTASEGLDDGEQELAGSLFVCTPGPRGTMPFAFAG